jgi:hypothetical protein
MTSRTSSAVTMMRLCILPKRVAGSQATLEWYRLGEFWLAWAELLRKTVGVDPEICLCGARMIIVDAINHASSF